jgi:NADPH:quinone reductase-like Zn-dependent oxidoreductase
MNHRVWVVQQEGGDFVEVDVPLPQPKNGEVLVKIAASGVCLLDTKIRAGKAPHAKQPLPAVLGLDMSGTVVEVGPEVTKFKPGDEVYGMVGGVGGLQGTLAEHISADADLLAIKSKQLSMREAAALPLNTITVWEGLVDRANVSAGKSVLVHAGAGGVGHLAVQIAKAFGAEVFATVSKAKTPIVQSYGATPIDYNEKTVAQYLAEYSHGEGFDIIYDTLGGATLDASFKSAKYYTGHVISCLGWGKHALAPLSFRGATYSGVFTLVPLQTGKGRAHHGEILARATEFANAGKLRPLVSERHFTTKDIAAAHAYAETSSTGKAVVEIG